MARLLHFKADTVVAFDRGCVDTAWWQKLDDEGVYFVTRFKSDLKIEVLEARGTPGS